MNITREDIDTLNAIVRIDLAREDYEEQVEKKLKDYRRSASVKGFRPGHVPIQLIRKMYGTTVLIDEVNSLVSGKLMEYIKSENIDILGDPIPSDDGQSFDPENQDAFTFSFELGLAPQFEMTLDRKQTLTRYTIEPDATVIADFADNYARRHGGFVTAEISDEKDVLKGAITNEEGEVVNEEATLSVEVIKDEEIKKQFIGKAAGDAISFDIRTAFPNDFEIAGLLKIEKEEAPAVNGTYTITVSEVSRFTPAENNQELWDKVYGEGVVETAEAFEERITGEIRDYFNRETEFKLRTDARRLALENTSFELPDQFLKRWLLKANENSSAEEIEHDYGHFRDDLRWQLIKNRVAKDNELKITDEEIVEEAKVFTRQQFMQYGLTHISDEQVESFARNNILSKEEETRRIAEKVLDTRILDIIISTVEVDDKSVTPDEFNKLLSDN